MAGVAARANLPGDRPLPYTPRVARPLTVLALVTAFWAAHLAWVAGQLPDPVATHFGAGGEANGWMSRTGFVVFSVGLVAFLASVNLGIAALVGRLPDSALSLPHRDHWLAPERRDATRHTIRARMIGLLSGTIVFVAAVNHLILEAHRRPGPPRLSDDALLGVMAAGFLAIGAWSLAFYGRFRRPRSS